MRRLVRLPVIFFIIFLFLTSCTARQNSTPSQDEPVISQSSENSTVVPEKSNPAPVSTPVITPVLRETENLGSNDLSRIGQTLDVELSGGYNSYWDAGDSEVQVNFLEPEDDGDIRELFLALFALAGSANTILIGESGVYEVISDDPRAANAVRPELDLPHLQEVKLTRHSAFGELDIRNELPREGEFVEEAAASMNIEISSILVQALDYAGNSFEVVYYDFPDESGMQIAKDQIINTGFSEFQVLTIDGVLVECHTDVEAEINAVRRCLTVPPPPRDGIVDFTVRISMVPLENVDYMYLNDCTNALWRGFDMRELVRTDPTLEIGNTLPFFLAGGTDSVLSTSEPVSFEFLDTHVATGTIDAKITPGSMYTVDLVREVRTGVVLSDSPENPNLCLQATEFWPVNDREFERAIREVRDFDKELTDRELAEITLRWVREIIQFGGPVTGSRYGVLEVLSQGYGHCWDFSDVYITAARTLGLPSRQIAGWLYGSEGHIWSQVWLQDEGIWLDVDATAEEVGIDSYYIPLWGSIDGSMKFMYADWPVIERPQ